MADNEDVADAQDGDGKLDDRQAVEILEGKRQTSNSGTIARKNNVARVEPRSITTYRTSAAGVLEKDIPATAPRHSQVQPLL